MFKTTILLAALMAATLSGKAMAQEVGESFDVLGSVMETHRKEINSKDIIASSKEEAIKYREKIIAGWWEFMQANSKAKPGEYCAATFLRAKRVKREVDAGNEVAVVVSAMSGVTNQLVAWVNQVAPLYDAREYDASASAFVASAEASSPRPIAVELSISSPSAS